MFSLDMINDEINDITEKFYYLSYNAIRKNELEKYWEEHSALQPINLIKAIFHEDTLMMIRRHLRKRTDMMVNEEKLLESIQDLLKPDIIEKYKEQIRIWRVYKKNANKNKKEENNTGSEISTQQVQESQETQKPIQSSEVIDSAEQKPI